MNLSDHLRFLLHYGSLADALQCLLLLAILFTLLKKTD